MDRGRRGEILTFPDTLTTQGFSLWSLNIVGGEILTFPDTFTTQGLSLWSLNIVVDGQLGGTDSWEELSMCMQPCVFFPVSSL